MRAVPLVVAALSLAAGACTTGARSGRPIRLRDAPECAADPLLAQQPQPPPPNPDRVPGTPSIRVKWEALAVERTQAEAARTRLRVRDFTGGSAFERLTGDVDFEVVLLNTSYTATPEQSKEDKGQPPVGRVARMPDRDMTAFLLSLEASGFFRYAQPTGSVAPLFASENARGRITVERDGVSVTLLSMRGQGRNETTRPIVGIYSEAKQAVQVLKNRSPTLRFRSTDRDPVRRVPATPKPAGGEPAAPSGSDPAPAGSGAGGGGVR